MDPVVKEDILKVLVQAMELIEAEEFAELASLSNHTIHNASIVQDEDSLSVAVMMYTLSKVMQRCTARGISCPASIMRNLKKADAALVQDNEATFRDAIAQMMKDLKELDKKVKFYIEEVIDMAKIKKGSKLHEHGLSVQRAAAMLGISQWELMNYLGKTTIMEEGLTTKGVKGRLEFARGLFR